MSRRASKMANDTGSMPPAAKDRSSNKDAGPRLTGIGNAATASLLRGAAGGKAVPAEVRARMEHSLGIDLAGVRVRDDGGARNAAESLDAEAFVRDGQIYWGSSAPPLDSTEAAPLLAHEISHVAQQREANSLEPRVSQRGDASEAQANVAAGRALAGQAASSPARGGGAGAVAATQRQPKKDSEAAKSEKEIAEALVTAFLQKVANTTPPQNIKKAKVVREALRKLAFSGGPSAALIDVDKFIDADSTSSDPAVMARQFVAKVPRITKAGLADLEKAKFIDDQAGTVSRVVKLVKDSGAGGPETPPLPGYVSPSDQAKDTTDKMNAMRGTKGPTTYGPGAVDVLQVGRIFGGLKGAVKAPPTKAAPPQAEVYPAVTAAIAKIPKNALLPAEAKGNDDDGNWADPGVFAEDLARQLDVAQKSNQDTITLNLGDQYAGVKDREAIRDAVEAIITQIRQALPHHAANVKYVVVKTGKTTLTRGMVVTP